MEAFSLTVFNFWYTLGEASSEQERTTALGEDLCIAELGGCRSQSLPEDLGSWDAKAESQHRPWQPPAPHPHQPRSRVRVADELVSFIDWSGPQISSPRKMSRLFLWGLYITYHFLYIASLHTRFWKECRSLLSYIPQETHERKFCHTVTIRITWRKLLQQMYWR